VLQIIKNKHTNRKWSFFIAYPRIKATKNPFYTMNTQMRHFRVGPLQCDKELTALGIVHPFWHPNFELSLVWYVMRSLKQVHTTNIDKDRDLF
jgi:hypothetical protein